jgi:hypothetical protein
LLKKESRRKPAFFVPGESGLPVCHAIQAIVLNKVMPSAAHSGKKV